MQASGTGGGGDEVRGFVCAVAGGSRFDSLDGDEGRGPIAGFNTKALSLEAGKGGTAPVVAVTGAGFDGELWKDDVCVDAGHDVCGDVEDRLICDSCLL